MAQTNENVLIRVRQTTVIDVVHGEPFKHSPANYALVLPYRTTNREDRLGEAAERESVHPSIDHASGSTELPVSNYGGCDVFFHSQCDSSFVINQRNFFN